MNAKHQAPIEEIEIEVVMVYFFHCLECGEKNDIENEDVMQVSCVECGKRYVVKDEENYFIKDGEDGDEMDGEKLKDVV